MVFPFFLWKHTAQRQLIMDKQGRHLAPHP